MNMEAWKVHAKPVVVETLTAEKRVQEDGTKFINEFEVRHPGGNPGEN